MYLHQVELDLCFFLNYLMAELQDVYINDVTVFYCYSKSNKNLQTTEHKTRDSHEFRRGATSRVDRVLVSSCLACDTRRAKSGSVQTCHDRG